MGREEGNFIYIYSINNGTNLQKRKVKNMSGMESKFWHDVTFHKKAGGIPSNTEIPNIKEENGIK
jgi:hypothetical protein